MRPTSMTSLPLKFQLLLMDYEPQCSQAGNLGIKSFTLDVPRGNKWKSCTFVRWW